MDIIKKNIEKLTGQEGVCDSGESCIEKLLEEANTYSKLGNISKQKELLEEALAIQANHYKTRNHVDIARTLVNLARAHDVLGNTLKQKELLEEALAIQTNHYKTRNHVDIAITLVNLANANDILGNSIKQRELLEEALAIQVNHYKTRSHVDISETIHNLAVAYGKLGDITKAKELIEEALAIQINHHKTREHIDIARMLVNLANVHYKLGNTNEQKELLEEALTIQTNHYKTRSHVDIAAILANLARAHGVLGNTLKQKELLEEALAIQTNHYKTRNHVDIAITLVNLAITHDILGDSIKQRELLEEALTIQTNHYKTRNHIDIAITLSQLAIAYDRFGETNKKKELLEEALAIQVNHYKTRNHVDIAVVLVYLANAYGKLGQINKEMELLKEALAIQTNYYKTHKHVHVVPTLQSLAVVYGHLGHMSKKKELLEEALAIQVNHYKTREHMGVAKILLELADVYGKLGDIATKKKLLEEVLAIQIKHYGTREHIAVATTLDKLGVAYGTLGDIVRAKKIFEEVLAIQIKHYGTREHIAVEKTLGRLGIVYGKLDEHVKNLLNKANVYTKAGNAKKQKELLEEALDIQVKRYKTRKHINVARTLVNLAIVYVNLGNILKGKELLEEALDIQIKYYNTREHEDVVQALNKLAYTYMIMRNFNKEKDLLEEMLAIQIKLYGTRGHLDIAKTLFSITDCYSKLGEVSRQKELIEEALAIRIKFHKTREHPEVLEALYNLAVVYGNMEDAAKGKELLEEVLAIQIKLYGTREHVDIARTLRALATSYGNLGKANKKIELLEEVLVIQVKLYKTKVHVEISRTLYTLAIAYGGLDSRKQKDLLEEVLAIQIKLYGTREHGEVVKTLYKLAFTYNNLGNIRKQKDLLEEVLAIQIKLYGTREHVDTAIVLRELAISYDYNGKKDKKKELLEEVLAIQTKLYKTRGHKEVVTTLNELANTYHELGSISKKRELLEEALDLQIKIYGTRDHVEVVKTLNRIASFDAHLADINTQKELLGQIEQFIKQVSTKDNEETKPESLYAKESSSIQTSEQEKQKLADFIFLAKKAIAEQHYHQAEQQYIFAINFALQTNQYDALTSCLQEMASFYLQLVSIENDLITKQKHLNKAAAFYNRALCFCQGKDTKLIEDKIARVEEQFLNLIYNARLAIESVCYPLWLSNQVNSAHKKELKRIRDDIEKRFIVITSDNINSKWWENEKKVDAVQRLYKYSTQQMKNFIQNLFKECLSILGDAPCGFAIIAFGSPAREEMTPYSDFEWGILIDEDIEENKPYFRTLTNLLHLKIINLGETTLRTMGIDIDDYNVGRKGLSFDGLMSYASKWPLGRPDVYNMQGELIQKGFELICSPKNMLAYQTSSDYDKSLHFSSTLSCIAIIETGCKQENPKLIVKYKQLLLTTNREKHYSQELQLTFGQQQGLSVLYDDMIKFDSGIGTRNHVGKLYDVKKDIYRLPNVLIEGLGIYYTLEANSAWNKIEEMANRQIITKHSAKQLKKLMSIVKALRLHVYLRSDSQRELLQSDMNTESNVEKIFNVEYLTILFEMYKIILPFIKNINIFVKNQGKINSLEEMELYDDGLLNQAFIYYRLMHYQDAFMCIFKFLNISQRNFENSLVWAFLGDMLSYLGAPHLTVSCCEYLRKNYQNFIKLYNLAINYGKQENIGQQAGLLEEIQDLDIPSDKSIEILKLTNFTHMDSEWADINKRSELRQEMFAIHLNEYKEKLTFLLNDLAIAYGELGDLNKKRELLEESLAIGIKYYKTRKHINIATTLVNLAVVLGDLGDFTKKKELLEEALAIGIKYYKTRKHIEIAAILSNLALVYGKLGHTIKKKGLLEESLAIQINHYKTRKNINIATTLDNLAVAYGDLGDLNKKRELLEEALTIEIDHYKTRKYIVVAKTLVNLAVVHGELGDFIKAKELLEEALAIEINHYKTRKHIEIATILCNLALAYGKLGYTIKEKELLEEALAIQINHYGTREHIDLTTTLRNLAFVYGKFGDIVKKKELLEEVFIIYAKQPSVSELCLAVIAKNNEVVKRLLNNNVDVNQQTKDGETLLFVAARSGYADIVAILLSAEADVNRANNNNITPLHVAVAHEHIEASMILLDAGGTVLDSKDAMIYYNLGYLYHIQAETARLANNHERHQAKLFEAESNFRAALEYGEYSSICTMYGNFLYQNKRYNEATSYLSKAIELKADGSKLIYNMAGKVTVPLEIQQAIAEQETTILVASHFAYYLLINIYEHQNQVSKSQQFLDEFTQEIQTQPSDSFSHYLLEHLPHQLPICTIGASGDYMELQSLSEIGVLKSDNQTLIKRISDIGSHYDAKYADILLKTGLQRGLQEVKEYLKTLIENINDDDPIEYIKVLLKLGLADEETDTEAEEKLNELCMGSSDLKEILSADGIIITFIAPDGSTEKPCSSSWFPLLLPGANAQEISVQGEILPAIAFEVEKKKIGQHQHQPEDFHFQPTASHDGSYMREIVNNLDANILLGRVIIQMAYNAYSWLQGLFFTKDKAKQPINPDEEKHAWRLIKQAKRLFKRANQKVKDFYSYAIDKQEAEWAIWALDDHRTALRDSIRDFNAGRTKTGDEIQIAYDDLEYFVDELGKEKKYLNLNLYNRRSMFYQFNPHFSNNITADEICPLTDKLAIDVLPEVQQQRGLTMRAEQK